MSFKITYHMITSHEPYFVNNITLPIVLSKLCYYFIANFWHQLKPKHFIETNIRLFY
jgi:hypothetical protein